MISDAAIRDALNERLSAIREILGYEPDADDIRQTIDSIAEAFEVDHDRVRDVYRSYIAARLTGG